MPRGWIWHVITNPDEFKDDPIPTPVEATTAPVELRSFADVDHYLSHARYDELAVRLLGDQRTHDARGRIRARDRR